jgi:hypothetical protein
MVGVEQWVLVASICFKAETWCSDQILENLVNSMILKVGTGIALKSDDILVCDWAGSA